MGRVTRKNLLEQYAGGRRDFSGLRLAGIDLGERNSGKGLTLTDCNFTDTDLRESCFVGSDLSGTLFTRANLHNANFARAALVDAQFDGAFLFGANLNLADCHSVSMRGADLSCATLCNVDLSSATLDGIILTAARLKDVLLYGAVAQHLSLHDTVFSEVDLTLFAGAEFTDPEEKCDVDWSAIACSLRLPQNELQSFLVRIGMPESVALWTIDATRALDPRKIFSLMQSTFISYGGPDEKFAASLRDELQKCGVSTFLFRDNAVPGEKLHRMMRLGVNSHDRVVLICSKASLQRPGVLNEIEETLQREARDGGATYLLPIRIDDYVLREWKPANPDMAQAVRDRVIGDFREAAQSPSKLRDALPPLLAALKKRSS